MNSIIYEISLVLIGLLGLLVVVTKSPINSVIYLCGVYLLGGAIFLLLDHYFLGLTLIIVYVGAIAILFLFTIFMINVRLTIQNPGGFGEQTNVFSLILALILFSLMSFYYFAPSSLHFLYTNDWSNLFSRPTDLVMLATMIFQTYPLALILVAYLLLIVMIAIIKIHLDNH